MIEGESDRRMASRIIDHIGDLGITVAAYRIGPEAEGGWELQAVDSESGESMRVDADHSLDAAVALAIVVGVVLEE